MPLENMNYRRDDMCFRASKIRRVHNVETKSPQNVAVIYTRPTKLTSVLCPTIKPLRCRVARVEKN